MSCICVLLLNEEPNFIVASVYVAHECLGTQERWNEYRAIFLHPGRKNLQLCCFPCRGKRKHCFASTGFAEESLGAERPSKLLAGCCGEPLTTPTLQKAGCVSPLTAPLLEALFSLVWFSGTVISPTSAPGEVLSISELRKLKYWYYMTCPNNAISCQAEIDIRGFENWFITLMIRWDSYSQTQATGQASGKAKHTGK